MWGWVPICHNSCVTLGKSLKLAESQLPHQYNVGIVSVIQDHGSSTSLPFSGCSWMVSESGKQCSQPPEGPLPPTPFIFSQTPGLFLEKKSKVYWNFKLHLRNQNPNPGDIHQDKVSESGKYSPLQNLLETSSLSTSPRHHRIKAIAFFIPCPQKDTSKPIVLFTWKFSTNIKKSFWITIWSPSWSSLNPILCSQHQWIVGLAFKRGPHMSSGNRGGKDCSSKASMAAFRGWPSPFLYF